MSILKHKIMKVLELRRKKENRSTQNFVQIIPKKINLRPRNPIQKEILKAQLSPQTSLRGLTSSRNIVKNYSTAIISFALSDLVTPYFECLSRKYGVQLEDFREFIKERRQHVNCIKGLRGLLLSEESDTEEVVKMKELFKDISIIFVKRFSVNWIYNSKIHDKRIHLNYRFKILRRIQNPVYFTYLEEFSNKL